MLLGDTWQKFDARTTVRLFPFAIRPAQLFGSTGKRGGGCLRDLAIESHGGLARPLEGLVPLKDLSSRSALMVTAEIVMRQAAASWAWKMASSVLRVGPASAGTSDRVGAEPLQAPPVPDLVPKSVAAFSRKKSALLAAARR